MLFFFVSGAERSKRKGGGNVFGIALRGGVNLNLEVELHSVQGGGFGMGRPPPLIGGVI